MHLDSRSDVAAHGVPLSSTRTRITARATGDAERAGVSHADGNGQSRRKVRYLDRETPLSRQTGASAGDAGATGRSGTSQTAQCKVRDRSHSHRGTSPAFFPIPQPSSERELYLNRSPCRSAAPARLRAPRGGAVLAIEHSESDRHHHRAWFQ